MLLQYGLNGCDFVSQQDELSPPEGAMLPPHLAGTRMDNGTVAARATRGDLNWVGESLDPLEAYVGRLADLNIRIFRSARAIAASQEALLTASSPCVRDIFENASALIIILNDCNVFNLNQATNTSASRPDPVSVCLNALADTGEPDAGLFFMVLACYQRLLSALNNLCSSIHERLQAASSSTYRYPGAAQRTPGSRPILPNEQMQPPPDTGGDIVTSPVAQSVMVTELVVHLIDRLDRALHPLIQGLPADGLGDDKAFRASPEESSCSPGAAATTASSSSSLSRQPPHSRNTQTSDTSLSVSERNMSSETAGGNVNGSYRAAVRVVDATQRRHDKLQERIREVKKLIKSSHFV
ncbi:hypothetical protein DL770_001057 [Monosporascus sp. CRB-9-2]|nr:hypothetical protein DL770_001057 [Monosporascus sp. CRB-9-2]